MNGLKPDILVVQEMTSSSGMTDFYTNVLNIVAPGLFDFVSFNDGPDTDNGLYFRTDKCEVVGYSYITTSLRDIAEYVVRPIYSSEQIRVYSFHLKASTGSANEQIRLSEATALRTHLNNFPPGTNFILLGDYNIYNSSEPAWQKFIGSEANDNGRAVDPLNLTGTWNNSAYALYHTQSPRVRSFGGGSNGGMDDRFDIILTSSSLTDNLIASSYQAYGNDGNHFNDSINRLPNAAVPDSIANALHAASDHIPVTAKFVFSRSALPVQLASLRASFNATHDSVAVRWTTLSETNNYGFEVQRKYEGNEFVTIPHSFIAGHGTTLRHHSYLFAEQAPVGGNWQYRLRQIDLDGGVSYSDAVYLQTTTDVTAEIKPENFSISQNYPNPFNPSTTINFSVPTTSHVSIRIYDLLGQTVALPFNEIAEAGHSYSVGFDGRNTQGNQLSSGVYFYRLTATSGASEMKRMILMR